MRTYAINRVDILNYLWTAAVAGGLLIAMPLQVGAANTSEGREAANVTELDTVQVEGRSDDAWGPIDGYYAYDVRTATKTDTPLIESPQSVSVITSDQIEEQGALTLQDAVGYTAGIRSDAYGLDSRVDSTFIRGVAPVQYLNGLRLFYGNYNNTRIEPFALERIEVLRGPSSVLYGQGSVGGIINLVSKRPIAEPHREIQVQYGNYDRKQVGLDFSGPLTQDGDWLYRMVALGRDSDTQVDFVENDRLLFAPSLTWKPDERTELTFLANIQRDYSGSTTAFLPWSGTLLPNPNGRIPTSRFVSEPGFDRYDTEQNALGWEFEHDLNSTWTFKQNLRYTDSGSEYYTMYPANHFANPQMPYVNPGQSQFQRIVYIKEEDTRAWNMDNHVQARWTWGPTDHTLLAGLDASHVTLDGRSGSTVDPTPFDVYNPVYGRSFVRPDVTEDPDTAIWQAGLYLQDQIRFYDKWVLTAGLRRDKAVTDVDNGLRSEDDATTYRVGMVYLADNGLAPYVSYSESFLPITSTDNFNNPYEPREGRQYEAGIRYEPPGTRNRFTASVYDLVEENQLAPDPVNPANQIQIGETKVQGLELEGIVGIGYDIDLIASYSYTDTETDGGPAGTVGVLPGVPEHMASLWGKYRFRLFDMPGFSVGAGVRYIGDRTDETETLQIPSAILLDAMVAYDSGPWRVAVNGANITDETYVANCLSRGDCFYGSRATVIGTVSYSF